MSNNYKAIIIAASVIVLALLASAVAIFQSSQLKSITNQNSINATSSRSAQSNTTFISSSSVINTSSSTQPEPTKAVETPKVETPKVEQPQPQPEVKPQTQPQPQPPIDRGSNPNPIQDIPNVTKLSTDKSIYWQYIKDYLACPTKFYQPLNGGYTYEGLGGEYRYLCIPQAEIDKCPKGLLRYGFDYIAGQKAFVYSSSARKVEPTLANPEGLLQEFQTVIKDRYYCTVQGEGTGSATLPPNYYQQYFPDNVKETISGYYVIPKVELPTTNKNYNQTKLSFAAIPLESFSQEDQQYIANNFSINK